MPALTATIVLIAGLYWAAPILAPVAFAIFTIAVVWPLQRRLQARLPQLLALAITLLVTILVVGALASLVFWGFRGIGQWIVANAGRLQGLYGQTSVWLEQHNIYLASVLAEQVNAASILRLVRQASAWLQGSLSFAVVTLVFIMLGLLEVGPSAEKLRRLDDRELGRMLLRSAATIAGKLQRYMLVRTLMSLATGLAVWAFALLVGLELAAAWGAIAFALNYIPFIGPLVATLFPTLFAMAQFESAQGAVFVLLCLNLIQFLCGSYIEPRVAGAALALSPFMVLFSVFFGTFIWGVPGALLGVPVLIAMRTLCAEWPRTRWLATVLAARAPEPGSPAAPLSRRDGS